MHGTSGVDFLLPKSAPTLQPNPAPRGPQQPALLLHPGMRTRLRRAVDLLVLDDIAFMCSPGARLIRLLIAAKANFNDGCITATDQAELARWLGVSPRTIADYLDELRQVDAIVTEPRYGEHGTVVGLWCALPELVGVRCLVTDPSHPLALSRSELATLLRLLEALIGPGWIGRDGTGTPPGLLAERRTRGAATDRLALVLLALRAGPNGRVRQRGGRVSGRRGRMAGTLQALLRCSDGGAEKVLSRLEDHGVASRERRTTENGLHHRTDWIIPAIAQAHSPSHPVPRPRRSFTSPASCDPPVQSAGQRPVPTDRPRSHRPRRSVVHTHPHATLGDVHLDADDAMGFSAEGETPAQDTSRETPGIHRDENALRAEESPLPHSHLETAAVRKVFDAIPTITARFTPGQRSIAARALEVILHGPTTAASSSWFWDANMLETHFRVRLSQLRTGDQEPVISSALGWFLSQLPESIAVCRYCRRTTHGAPSSRRLICGVCRDDGATSTSPPTPPAPSVPLPNTGEFTLPDWALDTEPDNSSPTVLSPRLAAAIAARERTPAGSLSAFDRYRLAEEQRWLTRMADIDTPVVVHGGQFDAGCLGRAGGLGERSLTEELVGC
ncbi:helix-turn-helix domain-containing protein (plasmid) [Embleya sp. NBC_00888]|uniref:hypothetical protein n=1 Tax=Embleya sp. NBC_00888 TaxID=2975960 RepID=UPI003866B095|nr:helix-turn-helix domain-containing protein [Embleya sp. NBC_00888]